MRQLEHGRVTCLRSHWEPTAESGLGLKSRLLCQDIVRQALLSLIAFESLSSQGLGQKKRQRRGCSVNSRGAIRSLKFFANGERGPESVCSLSIQLCQTGIPIGGRIQCVLNGFFVWFKKIKISFKVRHRNAFLQEIIITFKGTDGVCVLLMLEFRFAFFFTFLPQLGLP